MIGKWHSIHYAIECSVGQFWRQVCESLVQSCYGHNARTRVSHSRCCWLRECVQVTQHGTVNNQATCDVYVCYEALSH